MPACVTPGLPLMTPGGDEGPAQAAPGDGTSAAPPDASSSTGPSRRPVCIYPFSRRVWGPVVYINYLVSIIDGSFTDLTRLVTT